uniref:NACHT domain-containing protein n=1 Tax=Clytia hemisphaerica TaxID=252671 RepID=A0A7M5V4V2_9CNID
KTTLNQKQEMGSCCLQEVLDYVIEEIGEEDKQLLLSSLNITKSKTLENLEEVINNVTWPRLSYELERLGRVDIVKHITKRTLITSDILIASSKLRSQCAEDIISSLVNEPLIGDRSQVHYQYNENLYTDLAVLKATEVDRETNNSDREALMEQRLLQKESIVMKDLFQSDDEVVFVRAVGGMGKTTMLEMYTHKLAKRELNIDFPVEFVFFFSCREINLVYKDIESVEELFRFKYPNIFKRLTLTDLEPIADRILIIIDGLDELQGVYECSKKTHKRSTCTPFKLVFDLINPKGHVLKGHKSIASGRPKACDFLKRKFIELKELEMKVIKIKTVEVCGFKDEDVEKYIERFFNGDVAKVKRVKDAICYSNNLKVMATVPVFTWVICNVYGEDLITKPLNTCTELYMYACLVFLRKHLQGVSSKTYRTLAEMLDDVNFMECVYSLMTLSVKTYMKNIVLFTEKDIRKLNCPIHLEQSGLIVKYERGETKQAVYQYKHLALQEFMTGLFLCVTRGITPYMTNRELTACAPVIFGIHRLKKENDFFNDFFMRLTHLHASKSKIFTRIILQPYRNWKFENYILNNSLEIPNCMLNTDSDYLVIDPFMPECQEFLTLFHEAKLKLDCPYSMAKVANCILYTVDLRNAIFFIKHLNLKLKTPTFLIGSDSLIINMERPECRQFIKILRESKVTLESPYSTVRFRNDLELNGHEVEFLFSRLHFKLNIPLSMIESESLIIIDMKNPE